MTIGDAAEAVGVSAKAIRFWDAKGLLPDIERTAAGYRLFSEDDLAVLRFVRQAQQLGMTLGEIRRILGLQQAGTSPCAQVTQLLDDRIDMIDRTLSDLAELRATLLRTRERAEGNCEKGRGALICPIIERGDQGEHCRLAAAAP